VIDEPRADVDVQGLATAVADAVEQAVLGKREAVELVLFALLADGHVLIEDLPGLGKTLLARSFAQVCAMDFARIQFTPDLIPSDITGASIYDRSSGSFTFEQGPIFTNILLADEINRAPGKTQAALLEAMEERQVTLENTTRQLESPFLVLATQNPIEYEGTYPLPEAQLDRFLVRIAIGYPSRTRSATSSSNAPAVGASGSSSSRSAIGRRCARCRRRSNRCTSPCRSPSTRSRSRVRRGSHRSWPSEPRRGGRSH
jgi:MoxR-like ATPase